MTAFSTDPLVTEETVRRAVIAVAEQGGEINLANVAHHFGLKLHAFRERLNRRGIKFSEVKKQTISCYPAVTRGWGEPTITGPHSTTKADIQGWMREANRNGILNHKYYLSESSSC